jgi:hypothetical protein
MAGGSGPPDRTCVIRRKEDKLLVEQHTFPAGQAASPVEEGANHARSLSCPLSHPVGVCRAGKPCDKGHSKSSFEPFFLPSEKLQ